MNLTKHSGFAFCRPFFGDLFSFLTGLRKADRYRLFAAFDLSALAAAATFRGALFVAAHLTFDVAAGATGIFAFFCFLRHRFLPYPPNSS